MSLSDGVLLEAYRQQCEHVRHIHQVLWTSEHFFTASCGALLGISGAILGFVEPEGNYLSVIILADLLIAGAIVFATFGLDVVIARRRAR